MSPGNPLINRQLSAKNLCYGVSGLSLIKNIDMDLAADGVSIIMGQNGAGKSVLLRLLHGLIVPSAGSVLWNNQKISDELRRRQAMVFQKSVLLKRSVSGNVDFVLKLRGSRSVDRRNEVLEMVGLAHVSKRPAQSLSGGEQQRLSLACALANEPDILFLDEPTASLDPASVLLIEKIIGDVEKQKTKIIFVTHDLGQARRLAGEVVFLHQGKLEEQTDARSFFSNPASRVAQGYLEGNLAI